MTQSALITTVRDRFGPKAVITDPGDIAPWLTDWRGRWHGQSAAILQPGSTAEVAAIVTLAAEHRVALVPQGGNSGMVGGATPPHDGSALILSLRRMNRIRSISAQLAVAEAGVILQNLHSAAADIGHRFPLTLGARGSATIGGLVSTNAGGTQVLRFGTMRGLVAGVEAVLPDGSIHDGLAALKKDNRGPSLDQLFIGAEGTLGIVTAAALRLFPAVHDRAVAWAGLASPHAALALLRGLQAQTDRIEGFEIIPGDTLALVLAHIPGARAPLGSAHPWHLLIEVTAASAADEPSPALLERLLAPALADGLIADAALAANEAQADAFWHLRDSNSEAERGAGPAIQHDVSVPVDGMPDFMIDAAAALERAYPGTHASAFGHLGDGNVHFHVRAPAAAAPDWPETEGKAASRLVHDLVVAAGGSISAEHGIGQMKKDELARLGPPARLHALRAIKAALDPLGIMNPGKLI
ncbi:MAG: FAD-binding oxidoreductase [Sphingomicrobium sp.]